jgi:hypothetical protein
MGRDEGRPTFAEHYDAAKIILTKIYERLYEPRGLNLNIDADLLRRPAFRSGIWEGLPFRDW